MSEKEKETIEDCKELVQELKQHKDKDFIGRLYYRNKPVEDILSVLLNLIEKQQKEIDELRKENIKWKESAEYNYEQYQDIGKSCFDLQEIEQSHKEENGKLRVKLTKQEKMIEYMVNWINDHEDPFEGCHENEKCGDDYISCEQCIKQYFEKKAEEEN